MGYITDAGKYTDPEKMAADFLTAFFGNQKIEYPINPFAFLKAEGILFKLAGFSKLEGVYIPASEEDDSAVVGINANRPITRQRFTAAHELCHHFRDADKQVSCPINGKKNSIELFAEGFAAAVLMPLPEMKVQVNKRKDNRGNVSFDDVLEIANYFGVSFEACLYRIAYRIHAISGNTESAELKKRIARYKPDSVRKVKHMTYEKLYADLIDNYSEQLAFVPDDHARFLFQNEYIYNDSRMEGLDVTLEQASEIVTDLRLHMQNSIYCKEENEAYLSIAGHYEMYQDIFSVPVKDTVSVFDTFGLNKKLFSHYPFPEYGGTVRRNNTLVMGAKFETIDYHEIYNELAVLDKDVKRFHDRRSELSASEYIKHVVRTHHRLTVIHTFSDGNGRTSRAFMNTQFVRAGLPPIYILVEDKPEYIRALARADKENVFDDLYEMVFRIMIRSHITLSS